mgnify:CR=1 FL=1
MLNSFYRIFKLVFIFSTAITVWTSIILLFNTAFKLEINELLTKMYLNQKNFIVNVKDLSVILVRDANERFSEKNQGIIRLNNAKPD